ncbi:MAG: class I SAM-dependent methyltransferase [Candidatus Omnitrophica bacterium]|nr:class I SAM-dependent methyltransferase [Candidatus Omnitrophota bacterium]
MDNNIFFLEMKDQRLQLRKRDEPKLGALYVDFVSGLSAYRRKYGGGRRQAIARAVDLKRGAAPSVVDATAGLGRDAFVLASLGCRVHMIERSSVIAALLEDGLNRAKLDPEVGRWVSERLSFSCQDSCDGLRGLPFEPDVVYLDPMFPEKKKVALVKKEMRVLKSLVGVDPDADALLQVALNAARKRVVVKRPAFAGYLAGQPPDTAIKTKKNRFDVYL